MERQALRQNHLLQSQQVILDVASAQQQNHHKFNMIDVGGNDFGKSNKLGFTFATSFGGDTATGKRHDASKAETSQSSMPFITDGMYIHD